MKEGVKMTKKQCIMLILILIIVAYLIWSNLSIQVSHYTVDNKVVDSNLNNFKLVQISDFHNSNFGKDQKRLVKKIKKENPNIIVITGDFIDSRRPNLSLSIDLIKEIVKIAPVYYTNGNHEARIPIEYNQLKATMRKEGVIILENEIIDLDVKGTKIRVMGISDPRFVFENDTDTAVSVYMKETLKSLDEDQTLFRILLSHRPEHASLYFKQQIDLTLSGHAHGGQVRVPFIGGLLAPHQGLFPKYTEGIHQQDRAHLIISRGLGQSIIPLRINNRRELVVITIEK